MKETDKNKTRRQLAVHGVIMALSIARQKFLRHFTVYLGFFTEIHNVD
jgi:hypothetical protein